MSVPVMLTCFLTAVSTIGTSRQRQALRFAGFFVGGIVIGMSSQVFILPYLDSITGFTVFFILVTALAAWFMTSSPRLSFFGLQMGAMFFVINMQKFARETRSPWHRTRRGYSLLLHVACSITSGAPRQVSGRRGVYFR